VLGRKMSQTNTDVSIIENQVQDLIEDKNILSYDHKKIREELREHLELMEEPDDRQVNKISIITHIEDTEKKTLEVWLRDDVFHITEDELRTDDQKKRFSLEVERARILEKIVAVDNEFAKKNQQLKRIDPTREFIGMKNWDVNSLEAYGKIASLERNLRDWIHDIWFDHNKKYWDDDAFYIKEEKEGIDKQFKSDSLFNSQLRKIDLLDFSAYEWILEKTGRFTVDYFFNSNGVKQKKMVTHLRDVKKLRNKVMHRPPLNDGERSSLNVFYHEIIKIIEESKQEI